ncbi:MAG: hypothetical protein QOC76_4479 [Mycobacterium sp.]|nr:hypothetical protein [Mycobacterium sp.]
MRFTVRRPASAEVSPCCHRPSGGDVACSIHVGVAQPCVAGFALEDRLALTVFERDMPARGASLRRVRGRNLLDPTRSLVQQTRSQQTPSASADATVQTPLLCDPHSGLLDRSSRAAGHRAHVKSFDADRVEAPRDIGGRLFDPILPTIGLPRLKFCDRQLRASASVRAKLGAGEALLQYPQPLRLTRGETRWVEQFTGRQRGRHHNPAVDTHHAAIAGTGDRTSDVGEGDMPAAGPITGDPVRLHPFRDRPRQPEAHPADLGHPHPTQPAIQTLDLIRLDPDLPKPFMHSGFAPPRAAVRPTEEVPHRLSEIAQRLLLHRLGAGRQPVILGAGCRQLSALLVIAGRVTSRPPVQLLFDGQVPHIPSVATMLRQLHLLLSSRKQPISRHPGNVIATTDKSPKGEAVFPPPVNASDFHAASHR